MRKTRRLSALTLLHYSCFLVLSVWSSDFVYLSDVTRAKHRVGRFGFQDSRTRSNSHAFAERKQTRRRRVRRTGSHCERLHSLRVSQRRHWREICAFKQTGKLNGRCFMPWQRAGTGSDQTFVSSEAHDVVKSSVNSECIRVPTPQCVLL